MSGLWSTAHTFLIAPSQSDAMVSSDVERLTDAGAIVHDSQADWDQLVADLGGQPFQAWAWGELKRRYGWQPHRLSNADRSWAAQVMIRPYRGLAVAYVPRGPIGRPGEPPDLGLVRSIVSLARSHRAAFVRFEPSVLEGTAAGGDEFESALRFTGFKAHQRTLQPRSSIRVDLRPAEEELMASFSKGHRADVRRAERDGVTVRVATDEGEIDLLHQMVVATQQRKTFVTHSAAYYRAMWREFGDQARLLIAEHEGAVVGASLNLAVGSFGTYLVAGSTPDGLAHRAAHLLQWHAIRWAKERGVETWDLWGIADARGRRELAIENGADPESKEMVELEAAARADSLDGVFRFKKAWNGYVVRTVAAYDRVFIRPAYWYWQWRRGTA